MLYKTTRDSHSTKSLEFLYHTVPGRCVLKVLISPAVSKIAGLYLDCPLSAFMIDRFIRKNGIDIKQYKKKRYKSFNDFFSREIDMKNRPVDMDKSAVISPCDAKLSVYEVKEDQTFLIKGKLYNIEQLIRDKKLASEYRGGYCLVFRMCVDDYHRYCYIDDGVKNDNVYLPGVLHTVRPVALETHKVFAENSREYTTLFTNNFGRVIHMEVGAMLVGKIKNFHKAGTIQKGAPKGMFQFGGSSIVLLFEKDAININSEILQNTQEGLETIIHLGETIGSANTGA